MDRRVGKRNDALIVHIIFICRYTDRQWCQTLILVIEYRASGVLSIFGKRKKNINKISHKNTLIIYFERINPTMHNIPMLYFAIKFKIQYFSGKIWQ